MKNFGSYHEDINVYEFNEEPLFLQSEYYNVYFQKALENLGEAFDLKNLLSTTAQEIAYGQFSRLFKNRSKLTVDDRKRVVEEYFAYCGFGKLDLKPIQAKGGHVDVAAEHYASAWVRHFGPRAESESGVCYYTLGFLCGIIEAIFDAKPGVFDGKQLMCTSKGDDICRFEIYRGFKRKLNPSPGMGKPTTIGQGTAESPNETTKVVLDLNPNGLEDDEGLIKMFDTTFTRHSVNYFALIEIKLLMQARKKLGSTGMKQVKNLIAKTSERNAYFTYSRILNSDFWQAHLKEGGDASGASLMTNLLNITTGMGLGKWSLIDYSGDEVKVSVSNSPRTNAYLKLVGNTKAPIGFYNGGLLVGLANLVAQGASDSMDKEQIEKLAEDNSYQFAEETSRMTGAEEDTLIARQG